MREKGELIEGMYTRVDPAVLTDFVKEVLVRIGVPDADAAITAQNLVKADLRGIESHGVARLKRYTDGIRNGVVKTHPEIKVVRESPVTALLDGDAGLGQVVSYRAMNLAIDKARKNYVGLVGVRNSNHFGIAGFYGLMALQQDLIGLVMTNTRPLVAPTFSKQKLVGTNPICLAVPTSGQGFVLDMATSVAPIGKMEVAKRVGKKVPIGWGIDPDGNLTDDPDKISKGALLPLGGLGETLGGHKGYGLGAMVDIFSGILTGAQWSSGVGETQGPTPADVGHFFGAINVEAFMGLPEFKSRMDQLVAKLKGAERLPGAEEIYVAGEKSFYTEGVRRQMGVALDAKTVELLRQLGQETGVPFKGAK
ncbi:MAG TPA: Ldh family oxidoreductase [Conexivisphaerales archaeon]|nr:Ldh family oxidoreductase [Conexivisphaerales archaeon]